MTSIAIIGAGMSGLAAAHSLETHLPNATIHIFEKSRGVGRLATRYQDTFQYDFGAPHFRVKHEAFAAFLAPFIQSGCVTSWHPTQQVITDATWQPHDDAHPFFISTPKMTSLGRAIASSLSSQLHVKTRVASLKVTSSKKTARQWQLLSDEQDDLGTFDWVICTAPTAQAVEVLPEVFAHFSTVKNTKIDACFTLMLG